MLQETPNQTPPTPPNLPPHPDDDLYTVPAEGFFDRYQALTNEELIALGEPPLPEEEISEALIADHSAFLKPIFFSDTPDTQIQAELLDPTQQKYEDLAKEEIPTKAGEYTLNPETQNLDFEQTKIFIPDLSAYNGRPLHEVAQDLQTIINEQKAKTGKDYYLPGIEYWQWLIVNPDKSPVELKNGKWNFFFGSLLRTSDGLWCVPCAYWDGGSWRRRAYWLGRGWISSGRVVLLEK